MGSRINLTQTKRSFTELAQTQVTNQMRHYRQSIFILTSFPKAYKNFSKKSTTD